MSFEMPQLFGCVVAQAESSRAEPTSSAAPVRILCMGFPLTSSTTAAGRVDLGSAAI